MVNNIIGKINDKRNVISKLKIDDIKCNNSILIANKLTHHFGTIGKINATQIQNSVMNIETYLNKIKVNKKSLFLQPVTLCELTRIFNMLPNKISSGWDGLSNKLMKSLHDVLVKPLLVITIESLQTGVFPELMKIAHITPLYKSGSMVLCNNYRPISLLPVLSKIIEKIMHSHLYNFLHDTGQIYQSQYGF